jgi:EmrB/QacA subfamily drug resistance transporter
MSSPGTTATATDEAPGPQFSHKQIVEILWGLLLALFVSSLSATVVATALPTIVGDLGGQDKLAWVVSATLLTTTVSTPLWGKLSDLWGRKRLFKAAIVVFVVASALAGLSQNMGQLIGARALQGVGAGGLQALTQAIMGDIVSPRERGRYSGYLGASFGLATVAGPLLGGFLVDGPGWRWCFYVGIPVAAVALVVIERVLKLPVVRREAKVDWAGAALITGSASALLLLLSLGGQEFAWSSTWTWALGALSVVLAALAVAVERRVAEPILPPRLFRSRTFVLTGVASLFVGVAMFGGMTYLPQYLQVVKGASPTVSGLLTLPLVAALLVASIGSGKVITRTGRWKAFPLVGLLLVALGLFLFSRLHAGTALPVTCGYMAVLGLGLGMTMQVLILAVQNTTPMRDMGIATSAASFFRSMGGSVGVAMFGAILTSRLTAALPRLLAAHHVPASGGSALSHLGTPQAIGALPEPVRSVVREAFTIGLDRVFLVAAPLAVLGFLVVLMVKEVPLRTRAGHDLSREVVDAERETLQSAARAGV